MRFRMTRRQFLGGAMGGAATLAAMPRTGHAATATPPAPESAFLRLLGTMPDRPDLVAGGVAFADVGAVKRLYGFTDVRTPDDYRSVSTTAFRNAIAGCYLTSETIDFSPAGQYRDLFGYDFFQIEREIATGQPPDTITRAEGAFDVGEIAAKLRDGGYTTVNHRGADYATVRGDYQIAFTDPRSRLVLARLNRIAYDGGRIVTTRATGLMEAALDAEPGRVPTPAATPPFRALALALGDVTSLGTLNGDIIASSLPDRVPEAAREYVRAQLRRGTVPLRPATLTAMGYTDRGANDRVMHAVRVYAHPDDAAADAPELERRIAGYTLISNRQPLIPTYATGVTTRAEMHAGLGVLVADIALTPTPVSARLWLQMYLSRDTLFLLPDPAPVP